MNKKRQSGGFSLIEVLTYVVISSLLLAVTFNLLRVMFQINGQLRVAHEAQQNVRLLDNVFMNSAHNTVRIEDLRPSTVGVLFYISDEKRFSLVPSGNRITYFEEEFDQLTNTWLPVGAGPIPITTSRAVVSDWVVTPIKMGSGSDWNRVCCSLLCAG
jgi:type II secretory pathway pseudopilin PulG